MSSIRKRVDSFIRAIQPPIKPTNLLQKPTLLALPLFTFGSVMLAYLVGSKSEFLRYLNQAWTIYLGLGGMVIALLLHRLPRLHYGYKYDLFLLGSVLIWFSYWQREYRLDAPVFYCYPIYFILLGLGATYWASGNDELKDPEAELLKIVRRVYGFSLFQIAPFLVLLSLFLPQIYLIYPVLTSLLILYYVFTAWLHAQPILYLRSDPEDKAAGIFSDLVYPIASRYGPVVALVYLGPNTRLSQGFKSYKNTRTYWIAHEAWKRWVQTALSHCFVVILDIRGGSAQDNGWELNQVLLRVPHHRVTLISSNADSIPVDVLNLTMKYPHARAEDHARLSHWFKQKVHL
jgi:hypothetical protein